MFMKYFLQRILDTSEESESDTAATSQQEKVR